MNKDGNWNKVIHGRWKGIRYCKGNELVSTKEMNWFGSREMEILYTKTQSAAI